MDEDLRIDLSWGAELLMPLNSASAISLGRSVSRSVEVSLWSTLWSLRRRKDLSDRADFLEERDACSEFRGATARGAKDGGGGGSLDRKSLCVDHHQCLRF